MKEEWRDIPGFKYHYQVSRSGGVRKIYKVKTRSKNVPFITKVAILNGGRGSNGYEFVDLTRNTMKSERFLRHRLVAQAFISNPNNLPVVNHKDGNIHNNCAENLEWCTQSYNLAHAVKIGLMPSQCKIRRKVIVKYGEKIIVFETMKDCAAFFGFKKGWLQNRIRKHGLAFDYKDYHIEVSERRGA